MTGAAQRAPVVSSEAISKMHASGTIAGIYGLVSDGYGFGALRRQPARREPGGLAGGQGHGWMTDLHMLPDAGAAIVILTNR